MVDEHFMNFRTNSFYSSYNCHLITTFSQMKIKKQSKIFKQCQMTV